MSRSSREATRKGEQEPRVRVEPRGRGDQSDTADALRLADYIGVEPYPWESDVLGSWLARREDYRLLYPSCGLSVPRQNGKNLILELREVEELVVGGHILHTAHRVKTAKKSFSRLSRYFGRDCPDLENMVVNIRRTNGEEAIYLSNGGSIEFVARNRGASRGFDDITLVVFDEAQELTDEQLEAIMFTLAASQSGDRQMIFTGTPPGPTSPGEVFGRTRDAALSGKDGGLCWHEWSVEECPPKYATFESLVDHVYAANPSMGYTLDVEFTQTEFSKSSIDGFARERLGWWSGASANMAIPGEVWDASYVDDVPPGGKRAFGVKFAPDGSKVSIAGARVLDNGVAHVQLIGSRPLSEGVSWLVDFLIPRSDRTACVVVDGLNGADSLVERIKGEFPKQAIVCPGSSGVIAAANTFLQALKDGLCTHWRSEGQAQLDESARTCVKRPIGSRGGWGFGGDDSSPIEAAALAYWGGKTTKRDPEGGCVLL